MKKKKSGASNYLCIAPIFNSCLSSGNKQPSNDAAGRNRLSFSFPDSLAGGKTQRQQQQQQPEEQNSIEAAGSMMLSEFCSSGCCC